MSHAPLTSLRVMFRVAAGPRLGFGHLVRSRSLARALGVALISSVRGGPSVMAPARRLGHQLVPGSPSQALLATAPDVLIIDDPSPHAARHWCQTARRLGVPVVSIHDLGMGFCGADLSVDGSVTRTGRPARGGAWLTGTDYTILDPRIAATPAARRDPARVLIALGGGPRTGVALRIADTLLRARPDLEVRIAGGFAGRRRRAVDGAMCLGPQDGLAHELTRCAVAIVGGGVSLYEAHALRTPTVAWPVVRAQRPTVGAFARLGLTTVVAPGPKRTARAARAVLETLQAPAAARTPRLVDGRGAARVARAIRALAAAGAGSAVR